MIRRTVREDLPGIYEMELELFPNSPWPQDSFRYELEENPFAVLFTAEEDGEIAGFADLWITYDNAQLADIGVAKKYQRRGIAGQLMDRCIEESKKNGCEYLTLEVRVSNDPAIALYRKYGFIQAAVRKGYYENGEDAWLMVLPVGGEI